MEDYELALLLTSLPLYQPTPEQLVSSTDTAVTAAFNHILHGQYASALTTALQSLHELLDTGVGVDSVSDWYDIWHTAISHADSDSNAMLLMAAVAALYLFTQANVTGPEIADGTIPECPFDLLLNSGNKPAAVSQNNKEFGKNSMSSGDQWAVSQLSENGEDLMGKVQYPQYLLLATTLFTSSSSQPSSWSWWGLRSLVLQQRLLSGRSATLREKLISFATAMLNTTTFSRSETTINKQLSALAYMEAAEMELLYGHVDTAYSHLQSSSSLLGIRVELTGALGVRTAHQQDPKAQLIVGIVRSDGSTTNRVEPEGDESTLLDAALAGQQNSDVSKDLDNDGDESDVLLQPKLADDDNSSINATNYSPLEQCLITAYCLLLAKGTAADEIKPREAAAYAEAVLRQSHGCFMIRAAALLQASRSERIRSRTRERALIRLEGLDQGLKKEGGITVDRRLKAAFTAHVPLTVSLRRELGESLVSLGLVGSALPLFESLELWDNLIVCYQLLDKRVQAEQLVLLRLEASPNDPRLLCALGDLLQKDEYYQKAWEVSGQRNARAQRSLARSAAAKKEYAAAADHWALALALNPLHPEGWFSLGYCSLKQQDYTRSMQAYTRCVQMDDENGEAWNNLAAVHMHLEHWQEAFNALTEAVKHKRDSWHTWDNYSDVAVKSSQWQVAIRACSKVVTLSQGELINLSVLNRLVDRLEQGFDDGFGVVNGESLVDNNDENEEDDASAAALAESLLNTLAVSASTTAAAEEEQVEEQDENNSDAVRSATLRNNKILATSIGNLMKQIAGSASGGSAFWACFARYYQVIGEADAAKECLLKRVRALQGAGWQNTDAGFIEFGSASLDLCTLYLHGGVGRELGSARMHLRGMLKQAKDRYEDHELYKELEKLLSDVEQAIDASK